MFLQAHCFSSLFIQSKLARFQCILGRLHLQNFVDVVEQFWYNYESSKTIANLQLPAVRSRQSYISL